MPSWSLKSYTQTCVRHQPWPDSKGWMAYTHQRCGDSLSSLIAALGLVIRWKGVGRMVFAGSASIGSGCSHIARMVHMHEWCTRTNGAHARMVHTHGWCTCMNGAHARMVHMRAVLPRSLMMHLSHHCAPAAHTVDGLLAPRSPPSHPPSPLLPCSVFACKAKLFNMLGVEWPFDRHDWTVDRCGKEVDYTIDYYSMGDV